MRYLQIDENNVIVNIVEAEPGIAAEWGLLEDYEGAEIGDAYAPPEPGPLPPTLEERLAAAALALLALMEVE